jgi:Leucine-rich repeat (LRR) protein
MEGLISLFLNGCTRLKPFPLGFEKLIRLKYLNLEVCKDIEWLLDVVEQLMAIKILNVYQCSNLKSLPLGLGKLSELKHLDLEGCIKVKTLPDSIGQFGSLQTLQFDPTIIIVFLDSLGDLTSSCLIQIYDRI